MAETGQMAAWADDTYFDEAIPMYNADQVLEELRQLVGGGIDVNEVFFFDHNRGSRDDPNIITGLGFGDEVLRFDDQSVEDFFIQAFDILGPGVEYHNRGCGLGHYKNADKLANIAVWTQGTVTAARHGIESLVESDIMGIWEDNDITTASGVYIDLPDYKPQGGIGTYTQAVYTNGSVYRREYYRPIFPSTLTY